MAQVKVSFRSTTQAQMTATRSLLLTVKKNNTRSQKTLDGSLQIRNHGETTAISTRVAELDQIIPQYLGVSKAVLESVIFCHQDDSLWPMSEPSVLKKKFDEIFEAMKYTKAIENIKILRKKQTEELAKYKIIEQHAKEDKKKGDEKKKRSYELFDEIQQLRNEVEEMEHHTEEAKEKSEQAFNNAARHEQIVAQLNGKRFTLRANQESVNELEVDLKQMAESDEELQTLLDQYEERVALHGEQQEGLRQQYGDLKHDLEDNRQSSGVKQSEIGRFEAQKEHYENQLRQRENLIKEAAKRHGIRGFDYDLTEKHIVDFMEVIRKMSRDQNKSLDRVRQENQEELRKAQRDVNQLNEQKSGLSKSKEMARSQITANDRRISDLQKNMNQIKIDEGSEATLKEKKSDISQRLKTAHAEAESERFDDRIREADIAMRTFEEKKEHLEAELAEAGKLARDSAQIDYTQGELKTAKHGLQTMSKVHGTRISQLVESDWDPATLEAAFQRVLSLEAKKVEEAESRRDIAQSKLDNITFKLSSLEVDQKRKRGDLRKYEKIVQDAIGQDDISDFEETLRKFEEEYELSSTDQAKFQAEVDYMESCLDFAQNKDLCRLCRRPLHDKEAEGFTRDELINSLKKTIKQARHMATEDDLKERLAELEATRDARTSYDLAIRLRDMELPGLQLELSKLATERDVINKQLEEQDALVEELKTAKQEFELLSKDVQSIVNYHTQVVELEITIRDLTDKQKAAGSSRGIDAIQADLKKISEEGRHAKTSLNRMTTDRDKLRNTINALELDIRDVNAALNSAQSMLKEKRALADRIEELKSQSNEQRDAVRGYDKTIDDVVPQIEQAEVKYDDINRRSSERVQRLQEEASNLSDSVRQLSHAEQEINVFIDRGGPQQLAKAEREFEHIKSEISRIEDEMLQVTRQLKKIEDTARNTETTKRYISDNLRYRRAKRSLQTLQSDIEELESHNAEQDKDRYEREGQKWQIEWNKLSTEMASRMAIMRTKDDQLAELTAEWETDYQDAAFKYRESHIRVETTKAAADDLGRYGGALDKAIMKYHTLKMEAINHFIEELWKSAYQGTDVDTIRIRADNETGRGNRSYNYRVVMVKQETEMDMRGRCSAGQKVLASIIIRLALAECFGKHCGIIALDEPTTNLDQQNITGLAQSLGAIITHRRKQANFQLIVITHDEQFLREMNCAEYADVYWRVGRDSQQNSTITKQMISEVSFSP
jgi:DNA repair protein RAD50